MFKRRNRPAFKAMFCLILGVALLLPALMQARAQPAPAAPPAAPSAVSTPIAAPAPIAPAAPAAPAPAMTAPAPAPTPAMAAAPPAVVPASPHAGFNEISFAGMVRNSDPIVQAVMAFLLLCSISSWAAFVYKSIVLVAVRRNTRAFSKAFEGASTMENANAAIGPKDSGAAASMWRAARQEWDLTLRLTGNALSPDQTSRLLQRLTLAMGSVQEQALSRLGNWMGLLATIGSTAPFIGLFGTVWGILDSFEHISASYNTSLSVVAPGIAEALLATAFGLFAAIPATMFYNRFAREIGNLTGQLDNITAELVVFASRDVERLHK